MEIPGIQEMLNKAAEAGAKAAIELLEKRNHQQEAVHRDSRLRNTKLLLKHYRLFKAHSEEAVFQDEEDQDEEEAMEILDLMMNRDNTLYIESIRKSMRRTRIIVEHIDSTLELYRIFCKQSGRTEELRRYQIIHAMYISQEQTTIQDIAKANGIEPRTVYKDINAACTRLSALFFGIDGLNKA